MDKETFLGIEPSEKFSNEDKRDASNDANMNEMSVSLTERAVLKSSRKLSNNEKDQALNNNDSKFSETDNTLKIPGEILKSSTESEMINATLKKSEYSEKDKKEKLLPHLKMARWMLSPAKIAADASGEQGRALGFIVMVLSRLSTFIAMTLMFKATMGPGALLISWFLLDLAPYVILWTVFVSMFHLEMDAFGGKGRAIDLAALCGLSLAPGILATPLALISLWIMPWLYIPARAFTILWSLILLTISTSKVYELNRAVVFLASVFPFIIAGVMALFFTSTPFLLMAFLGSA